MRQPYIESAIVLSDIFSLCLSSCVLQVPLETRETKGGMVCKGLKE